MAPALESCGSNGGWIDNHDQETISFPEGKLVSHHRENVCHHSQIVGRHNPATVMYVILLCVANHRREIVAELDLYSAAVRHHRVGNLRVKNEMMMRKFGDDCHSLPLVDAHIEDLHPGY